MEKIPDKTRMKVIAHLETLRLRKIRDILMKNWEMQSKINQLLWSYWNVCCQLRRIV
jgi:hypothetical protein